MNDLKIISDKLKIFCNHFSKLNGFFENVLNPVLTYGDKVYEFLSKHGEDPKILNDHNALVGSLKNVQKNSRNFFFFFLFNYSLFFYIFKYCFLKN